MGCHHGRAFMLSALVLLVWGPCLAGLAVALDRWSFSLAASAPVEPRAHRLHACEHIIWADSFTRLIAMTSSSVLVCKPWRGGVIGQPEWTGMLERTPGGGVPGSRSACILRV